jgi:thiol-disulfide isomerase/thioredoxin
MKILFSILVLFFAVDLSAKEISGLTDLDGKPVNLASTPTSKPNELIVFWATWCDECRAKLREDLPKLAERSDLAVITVNMDKEPDRAKAYVEKEKILLPVYRDPEKQLKKELGIFSVPYWALLKKTDHGYEVAASEAAFDFSHVMKAMESKPQ